MVEVCEVSRWIQLKHTLNNLEYEDFVRAVDADGQAILVDARTPDEYRQGSMEGAINIDYLSKNLADLLDGLDKSRHYYVFCRTSRRSARVCILMKNSGFPNVFHLEMGLQKINM